MSVRGAASPFEHRLGVTGDPRAVVVHINRHAAAGLASAHVDLTRAMLQRIFEEDVKDVRQAGR
jgi:hypothetical protein